MAEKIITGKETVKRMLKGRWGKMLSSKEWEEILEAWKNRGINFDEFYKFAEVLENNPFVFAFNTLSRRAHIIAVKKGWYEKEPSISDFVSNLHGEVSEAWEYYRHNNPMSDHIPEFTGIEEELADVIIRIMDTAEAKNLRVAEAVIAKMEYNESRPYKHGGKKI